MLLHLHWIPMNYIICNQTIRKKDSYWVPLKRLQRFISVLQVSGGHEEVAWRGANIAKRSIISAAPAPVPPLMWRSFLPRIPAASSSLAASAPLLHRDASPQNPQSDASTSFWSCLFCGCLIDKLPAYKDMLFRKSYERF